MSIQAKTQLKFSRRHWNQKSIDISVSVSATLFPEIQEERVDYVELSLRHDLEVPAKREFLRTKWVTDYLSITLKPAEARELAESILSTLSPAKKRLSQTQIRKRKRLAKASGS